MDKKFIRIKSIPPFSKCISAKTLYFISVSQKCNIFGQVKVEYMQLLKNIKALFPHNISPSISSLFYSFYGGDSQKYYLMCFLLTCLRQQSVDTYSPSSIGGQKKTYVLMNTFLRKYNKCTQSTHCLALAVSNGSWCFYYCIKYLTAFVIKKLKIPLLSSQAKGAIKVPFSKLYPLQLIKYAMQEVRESELIWSSESPKKKRKTVLFP